ncbi:MerR family transcriptional regulator [Streptomyces sp. NPDC053541]|uniref:MerR family transcriptional regulator n=1 Tax=Streptomyces sp. NPDC053541 TaxID=3365709 RepID=UPI0037D843F2
MRIGELARRTGTTARALRHYEAAGLISSARAANGYRVYEETAVVRVANIRHLLAAGLTLEDVAAFEPCLDGNVPAAAPSPRGLAIARERLAVLEARIAAQTAARDRLAAALAAHPAPNDPGGPNDPGNPGNPSDASGASEASEPSGDPAASPRP